MTAIANPTSLNALPGTKDILQAEKQHENAQYNALVNIFKFSLINSLDTVLAVWLDYNPDKIKKNMEVIYDDVLESSSAILWQIIIKFINYEIVDCLSEMMMDNPATSQRFKIECNKKLKIFFEKKFDYEYPEIQIDQNEDGGAGGAGLQIGGGPGAGFVDQVEGAGVGKPTPFVIQEEPEEEDDLEEVSEEGVEVDSAHHVTPKFTNFLFFAKIEKIQFFSNFSRI